ncbi:DEKNAAC104484 [Brettanomyces naardenensis]|uniref:DEKNAAC104484 n=1 Tax=Brettanomyces naardenensis TaxID=13370 RepID=A0A448YRL8_BRENA|nr:DEKNAAC104484 [Brettanomyces naardenensis]
MIHPGEKMGNEYDLSEEFRELCVACRRGDMELVDKYISSGINLNQMDEWDYSPLILASICGHEDVVKLLLEKGCIVSRDTFEGSRAIYGALNDSIRSLLLSYDITKAVDVTQPFASHISSLFLKPKFVSSDLILKLPDGDISRVHRFMLTSMSDYFRQNIDTLLAESKSRYCIDTTAPGFPLADFSASSWRFLVDYMYLDPKLDLTNVEVDDLVELARSVELPDLASSLIRISRQKTRAEQAKVKNEVQRQMCEIARGKLKRFVYDQILRRALVVKKEDGPSEGEGEDIDTLPGAQKRHLVEFSGSDVILRVDLGENYAYYPVHRAIISRSEYFDTLFQSSFADTSAFEDATVPDLGIIDKEFFLRNPETIPVVSLPTSPSNDIEGQNLQLVEILLCFLYFDNAEIPSELAMDTLVLADSLFIDRLKTMAAIAITQIKDYDEEGISLYDILRVSWQARVQRLETHVAKIISENLPRYLSDPEFMDIVRESAERIQAREDYDTIELIADIKFYLRKKYFIDDDEEVLDPTIKGEIEDENYSQRKYMYQQELDSLYMLVGKLGLLA